MTRDQQDAERVLVRAFNEYLIAYHWEWNPHENGWKHPRVSPSKYVSTLDAFMMTRANKLLASYPGPVIVRSG